MNIIEALDDNNLFGGAIRSPETWRSWRTLLKALFGLGLSPDDATLYRECTGRAGVPTTAFNEAWLICGRRAGKSFVMALIAVFVACFRNYREHLGPGERGTVMVIAADRKQARVVMRYVRGLLAVPILAKLVVAERAESFDLDNGVTIEVATASFRSTRGYTIVAALCDEIAFWPSEDSANPDYEVLDALRPGMATIPGAMLICASSPYARRGALHDAHKRFYGKDGARVLVWRAATRVMNPLVSQEIIDAAMERDPASASAEYLAEFRSDIENFVSREAVEACVTVGVRERAPVPGIIYSAFVDPSGGSADAMTLAIGHRDGDDVVVLDAVRERKPPFSPRDVVDEFATLLKSYGVSTITGDRYAGEWPRERFSEFGVTYEPAAKPKSDLYRDLLPAINSRRVDLLDDARLVAQLVNLERRTARGGRDSIDHAPGAHDDLANATAGVVALLASGSGFDASYSWVGTDAEIRALWKRHPAFYVGGWR
jgi:hypothetical protein